jgi:hypothetical protein
MDRKMILDHLAIVRRHVAKGEQIVARQREIVARLERAGCDASDAKQMLLQFEKCNRCTSRIATDWKKRLPKFQNDPLPTIC